MGFFKSIFGKDNDSATKVEDISLENQEKLQPNTDDVICTDDAICTDDSVISNTSPSIQEKDCDDTLITDTEVITYKEDNGIVSGYFNEKAFAISIYKRAKELTKNITFDRDKAVIDDLKNIECVLRKRIILDGEFVSKDDLIFAVAIDYSFTFKGDYFLPSSWDNCLRGELNLYSNYDGYFTNCTDSDNARFGGIPIKDGELLFTIKLANKPKEIVLPYKEVRFTYNMLSKDYLNKVLGIRFKNWLVPNYSRVEKGDDVLGIDGEGMVESLIYSTIKAPCSGMLVYKFCNSSTISRIHKNDILFTIYPDEEKLIESYPNEITVITDDFTKSAIVKGYKCGGDLAGFNLGIVLLNFEYRDGKPFILLTFRRKDINLNRKCSLHLLLDDDSVITLNAISNPIKESKYDSLLKLYISKENLKVLETKEFIRWQITNEDGMVIASGDNTCCLDENDPTDITKNLSRKVFSEFIVKFNQLVKETYPEEKQIKEDAKDKDSCYVYLMIDTTNSFYKIGISNNPRYREHTLQSDKPTIELLCAKEYPSRAIAEAIEASLHKVYANKRIRGEWFNLDDVDVTEIKKTLQ